MITRVEMAQRAAYTIIGTALAIIGLIFAALGVTLFPAVGILIAFPVMWLAFSCFRHGLYGRFEAEGYAEPVMGQRWEERSMAA